MSNSFSIREASPADRELVCSLLAQVKLGIDHVLAPGTRFWLAERDGELIGTVGWEAGVGAVLLRSAAVVPLARGQGVGAALVRQALQAAAQAGFQRAYLFSTGAGAYWSRLGFREIPVPELTAALPDAPQVRRYDALGWLSTEMAWRREL